MPKSIITTIRRDVLAVYEKHQDQIRKLPKDAKADLKHEAEEAKMSEHFTARVAGEITLTTLEMAGEK